jgi:hypothetical protein
MGRSDIEMNENSHNSYMTKIFSHATHDGMVCPSCLYIEETRGKCRAAVSQPANSKRFAKYIM